MAIFDKIKKTIGNVVNGAANTAKNVANNVATNVSNAVNDAQDAASNVVSNVSNVVNNAQKVAGNVVGNVADTVENVTTNVKQGVANVAGNVADVAGNVANVANNVQNHFSPNESDNQNLSSQPSQNLQETPGSQGTNGPSGTGTTTDQKVPSSAWTGTEPVDSYEEYMRKRESAYKDIYTEQTRYYDEQNQKTLAEIEARRQAAKAEAENQRNMAKTAAAEQKNATLTEAENQKKLLINMSEEQKKAVYAFAENQSISDMNYAAEQYQLLLDSINAQKESGMAMAEEQRQLLLSMSEEQRNSVYAMAERQRIEAENRADIERERGVVDARSSYEQNKASYGANAEAMESMGLASSGYSDHLNSKAYAQQRAETQAANARADSAKREARYIEDQARMKADSEYNQSKYNAEREYSDRKYEIDTTYNTNLLSANQDKARAEYEAKRAESETKLNADQTHAQNKYGAESGYSKSKYEAESAERDANLKSDLSYSQNIFNADSQARADSFIANQTADAGKFNADMSYRENILKNDDAIGSYRQQKLEELDAKADEDTSYARAAYTELLDGANSGRYSADQIEQLAAEYGLTEAQTESLITAANDYAGKVSADETEEDTNKATNAYVGLLDGANSGRYSADQIEQLAAEYGLSEEQTASLINAANDYADKVSTSDSEADAANATNAYIGLLDGIKAGQYSAEDISYLAKYLGLSEEQTTSLVNAANDYADKVSADEAEEDTNKATNAYVGLLDGANSGAYTADQLSHLAKYFGLSEEQTASLIKAANGYAGKVSADETEADTNKATNAYVGLLDGANSGAYTADQLSHLAKYFGLSKEQTTSLVNAANDYAGKVSADEAEEDTNKATNAYVGLLDGVKTGKYSAEDIGYLAKYFGLSEEQTESLITAANNYASKVSADETEADTTYARGVFTELLGYANSGAYTADQLRQLATEYGLSEEQITTIVSAANDYKQKQQAGTNAEFSANVGDNIGAINGAIESGAITEEQGIQQIENIQKNNYDGFAEDITYGLADTDAIDKAHSNGEISQEQYEDLKDQWNNSIDTSADFFYAENAMLTKSAAKKALDAVINNPWASTETKESLNAVYNSLYSVVLRGSNKNGSISELASVGNNFKVTYGGNDYKVESAGEVTDANIKEVAEDVGNDVMFGYNQKIYIKKDGRVFEIRKRANSAADDWSELYSHFFDNSSSSGVWTTYQDAVNAGCSNIKTRTEWSRNKSVYSTYEDYLVAMYAKYMNPAIYSTHMN